jgi:hypothetical protein
MNSAHSASVFGRLRRGLSGKTTGGIVAPERVGLLLTLLLIDGGDSQRLYDPANPGRAAAAGAAPDRSRPNHCGRADCRRCPAPPSRSPAPAGSPEEVIFINLEGAQAGETVQATLATGTTDADGRFYVAFVTPLDFSLAGRGRHADRRLFAEQRRDIGHPCLSR